jgi:hypothetical protein
MAGKKDFAQTFWKSTNTGGNCKSLAGKPFGASCREIGRLMNAVNVADRHTCAFEQVVWKGARKKNVGLAAMKVFGGITACKIPEELRLASFRFAQSVPAVRLTVIGMGSEKERPLRNT